jgi:hypothetical protein
MEFVLAPLFALALLSSGELGGPQVGDSAYYKVTRDRDRTSSAIRGGNCELTVEDVSSEVAVNGDCSIQMVVGGNQGGSRTLGFDPTIFTEPFLLDLAVNGSFQGNGYKLTYLGIEDASDANGNLHTGCTKALLTDIDGVDGKAYLWIKHGATRVGGIVRVDADGRYSGVRAKIGLDLVP